MNPIEFARNLFSLRMEQGWTVEDLAAWLDVTPETVCEWECAKSTPTMEQSMRMAQLYGVTLDEIVRNPKPHDVPPVPEPEPIAEEPEEEFETDDEAPEEEPPAEAPRGKIKGWEIAVIILLLLIIAAAVFFLIRPDLMPFGQAKLLPEATAKFACGELN